jgi:hypothetical protein
MSANKTAELPLSHELVEAIAAFPVQREVHHCGTMFRVSPFDIYATCPVCKSQIKLRSFAAVTELEDVFDAVMAWMLQPSAAEAIRRRTAEIAADVD